MAYHSDVFLQVVEDFRGTMDDYVLGKTEELKDGLLDWKEVVAAVDLSRAVNTHLNLIVSAYYEERFREGQFEVFMGRQLKDLSTLEEEYYLSIYETLYKACLAVYNHLDREHHPVHFKPVRMACMAFCESLGMKKEQP